jgi:hypothetical protein
MTMRIVVSFLIAIMVSTVGFGCKTLSTAGKVAYDCASAEAKTFEAQLAKQVALDLAQGNWDELLTGLESSLGADGVDLIMCTVAGLWNSTLTPTVGANAKLYMASRKAMKARAVHR